jgi:2-iminobutanoate/2-iminopropanoate deaminase
MNRKIIVTDAAPKPFAAYSQGVRAMGMVYVSGMPPLDPDTNQVVGSTIQEQTAQCLRNVEAVLKAAGSSLDRAVSATVIMAEESDFAGMNEEWNRWFKSAAPARQGSVLPIRPQGMKISIAMIAVA